MNLNDTPSGGYLTEADLRKHWPPLGCDQQGRYPEAAHAACEINAEEPRNDKPLLRHFMDWLREVRVTWRWLNRG